MGPFSQPAIGLDISDHSLEAVLIEKRRGVPTLVSYGRMVIPAGIVVNGYVERREELSVMVRKLLSDGMSPPLPKRARRVVFGLPESRVFSHVFRVPRIADTKELADTLAHEADAFFPYHHEELVSAHAVIDTKPDVKEVYYAAVHRETLKSYLALFHQANLRPVAAESEAMAIGRALLLPTERQPVVIVDIGARVTDLSVFDARGTQFSETLDVAGDAFTQAVADGLNVTFEEAEEIKKTNGLGGLRQPKAAEALAREVDALAAEIMKAVEYYEKRSGRQVARILIAGGSARMPGLIERLAGQMVFGDREVRVQMGDPWLGLKVDPVPEKLGVHRRGVVMATAIGLGLRAAKVRKFSEIDLLENAGDVLEEISPSGRARKKRKPKGLAGYSPWLLAGGGFLLFIATALATWYLAYRFYVRPRASPPPAPAAVQPAAELFFFEAALDDHFSPEALVLKAFPIEVSVSAERDVPSASAARDGVATGTVTLVNETGAAQPLVATTRLLSEGGVLFRLRDRVTVPAGGTVEAAVYADQPGPSGDIGPSRFTIPGLSPALQASIYARSSSPMTGGVVYDGEPFTEAELDLIVAELAAEARERLLAEAEAMAGTEFHVVPQLLAEPAVELVRAPVLGAPSGNGTVEIRLVSTLYGISRDEVEGLAGRSVSAVSFEVLEMDLEEGKGRLRVSGR